MDVQLELDEEELRLFRANPTASRMVVATGTTGSLRSPAETAVTLGALVAGIGSLCFATLARQTEFEESLRHGCRSARERLIQLDASRGGAKSVDL